MNDEELKSLKNEVKNIRDEFAGLAHRIGEIEKVINQPSDKLIPQNTLFNTAPVAEQIENINITDQVKLEPTGLTTNEGNGWEKQIGQYWLNRLGVVSLVIGIVFLVLYSFQYFSVPLKLLTSISIAISLIVFGDKITSGSEKVWYGHGLIGGGWALNYFTIFAMYFVPDLKIIDFYPLELALLVAVCLGAMLQAMRYNSQTIAVMATLLANLAIGLSGFSLNNNIPILIIAILVSIVALKKNWDLLFITLILASYTSHAFVSKEAYSYSIATTSSIGIITASFLVTFWLIFNAALFFVKTEKANPKAVVMASCLNAIGFSGCLAVLSQDYFLAQKNLLFGLTGTFYLILALLNVRYSLSQLKTVNILIGLFFVNTAFWMQYNGAWVIILSLLQLCLLAIIGLHYKITAFRWFSLYLSLCFFPLWLRHSLDTEAWDQNSLFLWLGINSPVMVLIGLLATIVFGLICWLYFKQEYIEEQGSLEKRYYKHIYFCLANFSAAIIPWYLKQENGVAFWSIQTILSSYFCIIAKENFFGVISIINGILATLALVFSISSWQWLTTIAVIIACYGYYTIVRFKIKSIDFPFSLSSQKAFLISGNIILTILLLNKLSTFWLSTGLALEGLALVAIGLTLKEKILRVSSLIVLSLLVLKLLFVDLANANSLQRIISFIAAGLVLLISSYIYTEFTKRLNS